MNPKEIVIYDEKLGLDGTMDELIDWAYRYDSDYSDEALEEISRLAKMYGMEDAKVQIPLLVLADRKRKAADDGSLPYEQMKLDKLIYGNIGYEETMEYGEVEIREEFDNVLISISGCDRGGVFSAAGVYSIDEFMSGDENFLEQAIGSILYYNKRYEDD